METDRYYKGLESKYWAGETNLIEESALEKAVREYPEMFSDELRSVFLAKNTIDNYKLSEDFDDAFWKKVESDSRSGVFVFSDFIKYAAVGIVIFGLAYTCTLLMSTDQTTTKTEISEISITNDTYDSPEIAFEKAKQALIMASGNLNKGQEKIKEIKRFHDAKTTIMGASEKE